MATMDIRIINPIIDLITNVNEIGNTCKSMFTFDIVTTAGANVDIDVIRLNQSILDYDKLYLMNGGRWQLMESSEVSFVMNATGKASVKVEIGNAGVAYLGETFDGSGNQIISDQLSEGCNKVQVIITDHTNGMVEGIPLSRCNSNQRCEVPYEPPQTNPEPPAPEIDQDTNIIIFFDKSGSMDDTLAPLRRMREKQLRDVLIPYYGSEQKYLSKVNIEENGSEQTLLMLDNLGRNVSGKVIVMVFQDEASIYVWNGWTENEPYPTGYFLDKELKALRGRLDSYPDNYYKGIVFHVATNANDGQPYAETRALFKALDNGTGEYGGEQGLSDRSEITFQYDIDPGKGEIDKEIYAELYKDKIIEALNRLGFNI